MKAYPPRGHRVGGLVMADPPFREVLSAGPGASPVKVVIVEGEPDFLTWATAWHADDPGRHAVCGIFSGAWCSAFSARLPPGSLVVVRTHADRQGDAYARAIVETLDSASFDVIRAPAGSTHVDR
ncbi:MAG: hypothetical protein Q8P41_14160 [Pseudomonadota bacterium]|nr:hypothetical protein [Pseudomonadota bacterium]